MNNIVRNALLMAWALVGVPAISYFIATRVAQYYDGFADEYALAHSPKEFPIGDGSFDLIMAALFVLLFLSGVYSLLLVKRSEGNADANSVSYWGSIFAVTAYALVMFILLIFMQVLGMCVASGCG
jgi:archaellum biogenesis protein FlaJ (TadC family)